jgi:hypothetical protein
MCANHKNIPTTSLQIIIKKTTKHTPLLLKNNKSKKTTKQNKTKPNKTNKYTKPSTTTKEHKNKQNKKRYKNKLLK